MSVCNIKDKSWINSARGVTQLELTINGSPRVITIIGELHEHEFSCGEGKSMSIYDYCLSRANSNKNCRFLFEYNQSMINQIHRVGSQIIRDVFVSKPNIVREKSSGVDIRLFYLTTEQQQHLYNNTSGFFRKYKDGTGSVQEDYIEKYKKVKLNDPKISQYTEELIQYKNKLNLLFKGFEKSKPGISDLQWAWCKVMDYKILWEISKGDDVTEFIVVVGENHRINITNTMSNWDNCIILMDVGGLGNESCVNTNKMKKICEL